MQIKSRIIKKIFDIKTLESHIGDNILQHI